MKHFPKDCFCEKLLEIDDQIEEIILFGSSVYAPRYASCVYFNDFDIFIFTNREKYPKEHQFNTHFMNKRAYLKETCNIPLKLHLFDNLFHVNQTLQPYRYVIFGLGEVIFGSGNCIKNIINQNIITSINEDNKITKSFMLAEKDEDLRIKFERLYYAILEASGRYLTIAKLMQHESVSLPKEFESFYKVVKRRFVDEEEWELLVEDNKFQEWHRRAIDYLSELEKL